MNYELKMTEIELAKKLILWLQDQQWDIYQEVSLGYGQPTADIVALRNGMTWVIETKMNISLALMEQAHKYIWLSNYVSIAIPANPYWKSGLRKRQKGQNFADLILQHFGIGKLTVGENDIREIVAPRLRRVHQILNIKSYLVSMQKTHAPAGNAEKRKWTPFQETVNNIIDYVRLHPGATLKEVINSIDHHYASSVTAKTYIAQWIHKGIIKNLEIEKKGKLNRLYLNDNK